MKPRADFAGQIISAAWQKERAWRVKLCVSSRPAFNFRFEPRRMRLQLLPSLNKSPRGGTPELYVAAVSLMKPMKTIAQNNEHIMKHTIALMMALGLTLPAMTFAQDGGRPQRPPFNRDGGPGFDGPRPIPPLMAALDANHDGEIDEAEIKNASEALRKMDKNGDGKLTLEELRPRRPDGVGEAAPRPEGDADRVAPRKERGGDAGDGSRTPRRGPRPPQEQ